MAAGQGFGGCGSINDPVFCQGTISAGTGGSISLNGGLTLLGNGSVSLGLGGLTVDNMAGTMSGGQLSTGYQIVGYSGTGTFVQSGGTNTFSGETATPSYLYIGYNSGSNGTYNLSGGQLSVSSYADEYVGYSGAGTFTQSGGTHTLTSNARLYIGYNGGVGIYNLQDTGQLFAGGIVVGNSSAGTFTQSGGTATIASLLALGTQIGVAGTYILKGTGQLFAASECIGSESPFYSEGTGAFIQSGGTNTVTSLSLGYGLNTSTGTYSLSDTGQLFATDENVGFECGGTFTQSGGINSVSSALYLALNGANDPTAHPTGTYNLDAGQLSAPAEYVGYNSGAQRSSSRAEARIRLPRLLLAAAARTAST